MTGTKPVIGVIACSREVEGEPAQAVKHRYLDGVSIHAGGVPLVIPINQPAAHAEAIVARLDAILLTGSASNIAPARYGSTLAARPPHDPSRDDFSAALIRAAIAAGKPVFGICRGLQEINVALGGSLVDQRDGSPGDALHHAPDGVSLDEMFAHRHGVAVPAGTLLAEITGCRELTVNSVHHQMIGRLAEGLVANAISADGVVEAVSLPHAAAPVLAVQWHPEWQPAARPHDLAFWRFVGEAARSS